MNESTESGEAENPRQTARVIWAAEGAVKGFKKAEYSATHQQRYWLGVMVVTHRGDFIAKQSGTTSVY